jgi:hypothetical protein
MSENKNSQYDPGLIVKEVHDFHGQSIRVSNSRSIADKYYTHFRVTYNSDALPTQVIYYRGLTPHKTTVVCAADVANSLQSDYILIRSAPDNKLFHIWFNVSGLGVNPAPAGSTGIEIPINTGDSAAIVATAIRLVVNSLFSEFFVVSSYNSVVEVVTTNNGVVNNSQNFATGFVLTNVAGTQELVNKLNIEYQGADPYYNGQLLKGYRFNVFTGEFEHNEPALDIVWDNMQTTFPTITSELYTYRFDGVIIQTVLVTYTTAQKNIILSVQKTRF